ncbi:hypothetical protein [[Eubacterium] cellulosolvens]
MWEVVSERLKEYPERLIVARTIIENGLSIKDGKIYCNEIEIPPIRIARVTKLDRRTVLWTIKMIEDNEYLHKLFSHIRSAGHSLKDVAKHLNFGVVEITPIDAKTPGILAKASTLIAQKGISIRQAIVDDPELSPEPKLTFITEERMPPELIPEILKINGVGKVSIY